MLGESRWNLRREVGGRSSRHETLSLPCSFGQGQFSILHFPALHNLRGAWDTLEGAERSLPSPPLAARWMLGEEKSGFCHSPIPSFSTKNIRPTWALPALGHPSLALHKEQELFKIYGGGFLGIVMEGSKGAPTFLSDGHSKQLEKGREGVIPHFLPTQQVGKATFSTPSSVKQ